MGLSIDLYVCDVTGEAHASSAYMTVVEVYQVGGHSPEENECITSLTLSNGVLPDHTGEMTLYVDEGYNFIALKDKERTHTGADLDADLGTNLSEAVQTIMSHGYDRTDTIESLCVNGHDLTDEL